MKTNIYMMLNDIESDTEAYQEEEWSELEAKKMKKKVLGRIHNKGKRKTAIAGVCIAASLMLAVVFPFRGVVADAMDVLTYRIGVFLGIDQNLTPYEQIVNQSITQDGITVTLNSVLLDEDELVVLTTETWEDSSEALEESLMGNIYINGVRASDGAGGASREIDEHTREVVMKYYLNEADVNQKMDVMIKFNSDRSSTSGWEFRFAADGGQLAADTVTIDLDYGYQLPDGSNIRFTKFTSNAMGQKIFYVTDGNKNDYDMMLKGTDNLGNPVEFYVSSSDKQGGRFVLNNLDGNMSDEAESLTLVPYAVKLPETSGKMSDDYQQVGEEFMVQVR